MGYKSFHLLAGQGGLVEGLGDGFLAAVKCLEECRPTPFHEDEGEDAKSNEHPDEGAETGIYQGIVHDRSF